MVELCNTFHRFSNAKKCKSYFFQSFRLEVYYVALMSHTISPSEDMASFEVLHTQNHSSGSFPSADYSFLPEVGTGPILNGDINHHINENFDLANMQSALATAMPDSTVEDHAQLLQLIEENSSLKEKLNKNNSIMKEQMTTIAAWRESMIISKDQLQQNLQKAKEKISALEKDKTDLKEESDTAKEKENEKIHSYMEKISTLEKCNSDLQQQLHNAKKDNEKFQHCRKCDIFEDYLNNMLAIDSVEDGESILLGLSDFRENIYHNLTFLYQLLESLSDGRMNTEEKNVLKTFALLVKFKISALECGDLRATVQTDAETGYEVVHQKRRERELQLLQDIEDLKKAIISRNKELDFLKKDRIELLEKIKAFEMKMQVSEISTKSQFELMSNKFEIETSLVEKYKERCESLQQQLEEYQQKLDKVKMSDNHFVKDLREEVHNLQEILKLEQRSNQSDKDRLSEVMLRCEKLQVDYDRVSKLLEIESKTFKQKAEDLNILKENEKKDYIEKIDQLTAQIFEMEEQMREINAEMRKLQDELAEAKESNESIPILKAQIEVYKTDYQNMESAKNAASDEVERLTNELKNKNESCHCLCKSQACTGNTSGRFSSDNDEQCDIVCPFCPEIFKNERFANRHILRCHKE